MDVAMLDYIHECSGDGGGEYVLMYMYITYMYILQMT